MKKPQTHGDLTGSQVREELNIGNTKFWELINSGEIEAYRVGNHTRVPPHSLDAYRKRHRIVPKTKSAALA